MKLLKVDHIRMLAQAARREEEPALGAQAQSLGQFLTTPRVFRAGDGCTRRMSGFLAERDLNRRIHAMGMHITDKP